MRQRKISNDDIPSSSYMLCRFYAREKCAFEFLPRAKDEKFLRENVMSFGEGFSL
jgi:hypothetical protein